MFSIKKNIPNTITCLNLACGVLGILSCLNGDVAIAFYFMLAAAFFDFFDGLSARLLHASSQIGKELDSLSDLISFGVLPSVMLYCLANHSFELALDSYFNNSYTGKIIVVYSPVILAVFSGVRLAKFNLDHRQTDSFIGLATPAAAILVGAFVHYCYSLQASPENCPAILDWTYLRFYLPIAVVILSWLIISEIPMFAMKIKPGVSIFSGIDGKIRIVFILFSLAIFITALIMKLNFALVPAGVFAFYIFLNLVMSIFKKK